MSNEMNIEYGGERYTIVTDTAKRTVQVLMWREDTLGNEYVAQAGESVKFHVLEEAFVKLQLDSLANEVK